MTGFGTSVRCVVAALVIGVTPAAAQRSTPLSDAQEGAIRALILETIRENPELLIETIVAYQNQVAAETGERQREAIAELREELLSDPNSGVLGNAAAMCEPFHVFRPILL